MGHIANVPDQELFSMYSEIVSMCTDVPKKREKYYYGPYKSRKMVRYLYVLGNTVTYHFMALKFEQGTCLLASSMYQKIYI